MVVRVPFLGAEQSVMRIGTRQLKLRGPRKANKPLAVLKTKSVPSETRYSLQARLCLAEAATAMRGHPLEEVVANVIESCSGRRYKPDSAYEDERRAKQAQANANIERMRRKLAEMGGRGPYPVRGGAPYAPEL
ncbi:MAG: hypothetical protein ACXQT3_00065 [Methermicoccaceae archaeon]